MNRVFPYLGASRTVPILVLLISAQAEASPWLEANDPFLRADLTALSDAGRLHAPINHYPLRWSSFYDDTVPNTGNQPVSSRERMLDTARNHIRYRAHSAKLNRAPIGFDLEVANDAAMTDPGYSDTPKHQWQVASYYQKMDHKYAFKVANQYREDGQGNKDYTWQDSYFALNDGRWLFTVGTMPKWWGQGWQHTLIWGTRTEAAPSASISYLGDAMPILGFWSIEAVYALPHKTGYDAHAAVRFISQPISSLQYGLSYQQWTEPKQYMQESEQWAIDAKLALPSGELPLAHAIYGELASNYSATAPAANLLGWSGQTEIYGQSVRIAIEHLSTMTHFEDDLSDTPARDEDLSSRQRGGNSTSYGLDNSQSIALYGQFTNDHAMSLSAANKEQNQQTWHEIEGTYHFPFFNGRLTLGLTNTDAPINNNSDTRVWSQYQLRF